MLSRAQRLSLSWAWWIHSKPSHPISLRCKCKSSFPLLWSLLRNHSNTRLSVTLCNVLILHGHEQTSHPTPLTPPNWCTLQSAIRDCLFSIFANSNNTKRIYAIGKIMIIFLCTVNTGHIRSKYCSSARVADFHGTFARTHMARLIYIIQLSMKQPGWNGISWQMWCKR